MANVVSELVRPVPIPRMFRARQYFPSAHIEKEAIPAYLRSQLAKKEFASQLKPGMKIAITVGSRQIANTVTIVRTMVDFLREKGAGLSSSLPWEVMAGLRKKDSGPFWPILESRKRPWDVLSNVIWKS